MHGYIDLFTQLKYIWKMFKFLSKILLIYIAFLALNPCVDNCSTGYCQSEGIVHIEENHTQDKHNECSPLCNCLCCNTIVFTASSFTLITSIDLTDFQFTYSEDLTPFILKPTSPPPKS